jgi:hypothetical protein
MTHALVPFLQAVSAALAWVSGLIFLRFWRVSRDVLFVFFGAGFWVMALSWALLALVSPAGEARPYVYAIRLLSFLLIIAGMIQKNRSRP